MRRRLSVISCIVVVISAIAYGQDQSTPPSTVSTALAEHGMTGWLVELSSPPAIDGTPEATLAREAAGFHASAAGAGLRYAPTRRFSTLWNGLALRTDAAGAARMLELPGVRAVYPIVTIGMAQREDDVPLTVADLATSLEMTGADIAQRELGLTGRHVRVAVIDSGIDYHHPDLGGCFGPGCRVAKGYDFVGDAFNADPNSPAYDPRPRPDADPDDCDGHGTHVSGIVWARGALTGVAPGVSFSAYRVFGCDGPTTTEIVLAAMERVLLDGADVLNMSLGAPLQWPQYPTSQAADWLVKHGIVVVASAGNDAALGLYASSSPATGRRVISVASFDNSHANLAAFSVSPDGRLVGYTSATGAPAAPLTGTFPLRRTGTAATSDDACASLPAGSLMGHVALIRRGTCGFVVKAANAQAAGAVGVVIYNNVPGRLSITVEGGAPIRIPVVSASQADGVLLDSRLAAGPVSLTWTATIVSEPQPTGGLISNFSSWGPAPDLSIKPDLGAPGGPVRSTLPLERGAFGAISGTSQAAPHVAGAAALLLEASPSLSAAQILQRLQNSSRPALWAGNPALGHVDSVHRQGAGLVAIDRAARAEVVASPSRLALGEIEAGWEVRELTLSRLAGARRCRPHPPQRHGRKKHTRRCEPIRYTLGHTPALATGANAFAPLLYAAPATVEFDREIVSLGDEHEGHGWGWNDRSGSSTWSEDGHQGKGRLLVRITPPVDPQVRLFTGYITLTPNDGGEALRVPYVGYNGDYQAIKALTPTSFGFPWLAKLTGTTLTNQLNGATYTLQGNDIPFILYHLDHQVRQIRIRVVDVATGRSFGLADQRDYLGRNTAPTSFFAFAWDGTTTPPRGSLPPMRVPNGTYRLEVSVLKALGDRRNPDHTERWISPNITIVRPGS